MTIEDHYTELFRAYGDDPRSVQLTDRLTQRRRFTALCQVAGDLKRASILDVGCGLAHLHEYLLEHGYEGEYTGVDVNPEFITACRTKFPSSRFEVHDIAAAPIPWQADYLLLNGVFNNPRDDAQEFLHTALRHMYEGCRIGIAFNAMSTYVDHKAENLVYFHPEEVFAFCKENLSPLVSLRHDYLVKPGVVPFEFAVMVYKTSIEPRRRLAT